MISCPKCAKENQDHYKFCLGCGAELPRDLAPKAFSPQTPPHGMRAVQPSVAPAAIAHTPAAEPSFAAPRPAAVPRPAPTPAAPPVSAPLPAPGAPPVEPAAPAAPVASGGNITCPQCSHSNISGNRFCAACGFNLSAAAAASAPAPAPAPSPAAAPSITLTALRPDGTDFGSYPLPGPVATVGRDAGGIFAGDSYLSPRHATIGTQDGKLFVRDEGSLNGVYRKLLPQTPVELTDGDIFRIGQEIIRFESLKPQPAGPDGIERLGSPAKGYVGRISLLIGREATGNSFPVPEQGIHIGRERGDVLFPEDGYVSGLHCRITVENGKIWLTDVGSSNGSFIRIRGEDEVRIGDILLMGQQLYRIDA